MTYDHADHRRRAVMAGLRRMALDERTNRLSPTAHRVAGAVWTLLGPRMARDERIPDLTSAVEGVDRGNLRGRRRQVADSIRRLVRGKLGKDEDLDDLDDLLASLCEEEDGEDEEIEAAPPNEPNDDPWQEPGEDRRVTGDDPVDFPGMPRPGGSMSPMPNENYNDVRFPHPGEPADARDRRLPRRAGDIRRPRRFGQDSAPRSFTDRFAFAARHTTTDDQDSLIVRTAF